MSYFVKYSRLKMKLTLISIVMLCCWANLLSAQTTYPKGVYMSISELKEKKPSANYKLTIIERTKGDIKMNGGNDYKVESIEGTLKKKFIKRDIIAISDSINLYINGIHFDFQYWYAKVERESNDYLIFKGGVSNAEAVSAGIAGGAIGGAVIATKRNVYVIDKSFTRKELISQKRLEEILFDYPELLEKYKREDRRGRDEVILKYLVKVY